MILLYETSVPNQMNPAKKQNSRSGEVFLIYLYHVFQMEQESP